MYCPKCGSKLDEGTRFCGMCGTPLQKNSNSKRTKVLIGVLVGVAVIAVALLLAIVIVPPVQYQSNPSAHTTQDASANGSNKSPQAQTSSSNASSSEASSEQSAASSSSAAIPQEPTQEQASVSSSQTSAEQDAINDIQGTWVSAGMSASGPRTKVEISGNSYTRYSNGELSDTGTIDPAHVERLTVQGEEGWYFHDLGRFHPDSSPSELRCVNPDGSGYSGTDSWGKQ